MQFAYSWSIVKYFMTLSCISLLYSSVLSPELPLFVWLTMTQHERNQYYDVTHSWIGQVYNLFYRTELKLWRFIDQAQLGPVSARMDLTYSMDCLSANNASTPSPTIIQFSIQVLCTKMEVLMGKNFNCISF